jgi:drug/metabolite transporter (DMT)-like permease
MLLLCSIFAKIKSMHNTITALFAIFTCAICNGTAAVLQKISADKEHKVKSLDIRLLWRLLHDLPYISGVVLDILGWLLTLYAVRYLPLFLVEAVIASNIIITALIERVFRRQNLQTKSYLAICLIIIGLVTLAVASSPERAAPVTDVLRWMIILTPIPLALAGYVLAKKQSYIAAISLAALGGLAFGGTSLLGRVFNVSQPVWHTIYSPVVYAIIASGILGILLFSTALQRAQATTINASMTASQTLIPAIVGIVFLGDEARNGLWFLVVLGSLMTLGGVIALTSSKS